MRLTNKLEKLNTYPFHMPGHKRNDDLDIYGASIDITEINGFDNLHSPCEILDDLQKEISDLFGYKKSIISVNGSTCGILSAISAVSSLGDTIIIARNCHKAVYNACYINRLNIKYIEPEYDEKFGCYREVTQEALDKAIANANNPCAVVITSPTYEGVISDIECDIPLIIDSAHGAHFGFDEWLPKRANGDIVIQSIHKTLPALTQTALVHINNDSLYNDVKKYMDIYESSSPSYVLMSSVDKCVEFLKDSKSNFELFKKRLYRFYCEIDKLDYVKLIKNDDITRVCLSIKGYIGSELADILRNEYSIEVEGATYSYVILITTVCDSDKGFDMLINALKNIKPRENKRSSLLKPILPKKAYELYDNYVAEETELKRSCGRISAEYVYAYPPACPILAPGEIISEDIIEYISNSIEAGVNILSDSNLLPLKILTKV